MSKMVGLGLVIIGVIIFLWFACHFMEWAMDDNSFFDGGDITDKELNDEHRIDE